MGKRVFLLVLGLLGAGVFVWFRFLGSVGADSATRIISFPNDTAKVLVAERLRREGLVRSELAANLFLTKEKYPAGGYEVSANMNVFEVAKVVGDGPQLLWVTVPPGWRKEQLAERLKPKFGWTDQDREDFLKYPEGEYFPDTYLVPRGDGGERIADRMHNRFNEKFAPYAAKFLAADIKNDTALKIASLVEREAGRNDKKLVAGIIWNRLLKGMQLKIDATVQYAKGKVDGNWWSRVTVADYTRVDSPYSTYLHRGLPPTPIASPGLAAIDAVLNPEETNCLYYLHDPQGQIHCSPTYEGHLENVEKYLR